MRLYEKSFNHRAHKICSKVRREKAVNPGVLLPHRTWAWSFTKFLRVLHGLDGGADIMILHADEGKLYQHFT